MESSEQQDGNVSHESLCIDFVSRLQINDCSLVLSSEKYGITCLTPDNYLKAVEQNRDENLYIIGGVDKSAGCNRIRADQIRMRNYFVIDIDVRNQFKEEGSEISNDEIKELGEWLKGALQEHEYLCNWSYIVFSGNGLHVWYLGEPAAVESPEKWKAGMQRIHKAFKDQTKLEPDPQCISLATIFRLPGSYNNKDINNRQLVEILLYQ